MTALDLGQPMHLMGQAARRTEQRPRVGQHLLASGRDPDAAGATVEQPQSKVFLQSLDAAAERGL